MNHIPEKITGEMVLFSVAEAPDEACGFLVGKKGMDVVEHFLPMKNIYNEMHEKYPETYPRTAKTAYLIDPVMQQKVFETAEVQGAEVKSIFHSHVEHDAYFSEEDRLVAAPWGEPSFPGITYIVVSIFDGRMKEINEFFWDEKKSCFEQRTLKKGVVMAIKVRIPTPLQKLTSGKPEVEVTGASLGEVLKNLDGSFPGMKDKLYDEKGALRRFINFYVNNEDVRFMQGEATPVKPGDEVSIVPAIAGGQ